MKKFNILTTLFVIFAFMSSSIYASEGPQNEGPNNENDAKCAQNDADCDWEGSNSGRKHDPAGPMEPLKHCTQDNKNGNKHIAGDSCQESCDGPAPASCD